MTRSRYSHRCYFFFLTGTTKNRTNRPTWIVLPITLFFLLSCATPEKKQSESRDPKFYNNRGIACAEKGQYEQAISDFNKAIEINPMDGQTCNNLAWLFATVKVPGFRNGEKAV